MSDNPGLGNYESTSSMTAADKARVDREQAKARVKRIPPRFALGDRVTFTDTVSKERVAGGVEWHSAGLPVRTSYGMDADRKWEERRKPLNEGLVIGSRTLNEWAVNTEYEGGEYGSRGYSYQVVDCIPGTGKKAWLVAFDMRRKPVLVLDEHIAAAPEEPSLQERAITSLDELRRARAASSADPGNEELIQARLRAMDTFRADQQAFLEALATAPSEDDLVARMHLPLTPKEGTE